nr:MAG TPA: hypothetical protein [Caudoviricetes sp.]
MLCVLCLPSHHIRLVLPMGCMAWFVLCILYICLYVMRFMFA